MSAQQPAPPSARRVDGRDAQWVNRTGAIYANRFGYRRDVMVRGEIANGFLR